MDNYLGKLRTSMSSKGLGLINSNTALLASLYPRGRIPSPTPLDLATLTARFLLNLLSQSLRKARFRNTFC